MCLQNHIVYPTHLNKGEKTCPQCEGTGKETDKNGKSYQCHICNGKGKIKPVYVKTVKTRSV